MNETSGHFRRLLVAQCNADRDESKVADFAKADLDAKDIFEVMFTRVVIAFPVQSFHPQRHSQELRAHERSKEDLSFSLSIGLSSRRESRFCFKSAAIVAAVADTRNTYWTIELSTGCQIFSIHVQFILSSEYGSVLALRRGFYSVLTMQTHVRMLLRMRYTY